MRRLVELVIVVGFALWVGRNYLDFDPQSWPTGWEFGVQIQTHHLWTRVLDCGLCALWNGGINGGYPALADMFGSMAHPAVAVSTMLWGVVNGAKVAIVIALAMAGLAQWWIALSLRVGPLPRVWTALLAVSAGHLAGRMEFGGLGLVIATASASLAIAAALHLGLTGTRRAAVMFAVVLSMALVSGQGYYQFALLLWVPAFAVFCFDSDLRPRKVLWEYCLGAALAVAIAGLLIVPMLHFWPFMTKFTNPGFVGAQTMGHTVLNLVIDDWDYLSSEVMGKYPWPWLYTTYIGWIPIILATLCLTLARRADRRALVALVLGALISIGLAAAIGFSWLATKWEFFGGFRFIPVVAGLAVPGILGLAAYGLDRVLGLKWPSFSLSAGGLRGGMPVALDLRWVMAVPLIWAVVNTYSFGRQFLETAEQTVVYDTIDQMTKPDDMQWVSMPFGKHAWIEPGVDAGLKVQNAVWPFKWRDRDIPDPRLYVIDEEGDRPEGLPRAESLDHHVAVFVDEAVDYAYVTVDYSEVVPCVAVGGTGGDIDVVCSTSQPGRLVVEENAWTGWRAEMDGVGVPLLRGDRLAVDAPAGDHEFRFRYRPWDVALGAVLTLFGLLAALWLWWSAPTDSTDLGSADLEDAEDGAGDGVVSDDRDHDAEATEPVQPPGG